MKIIKFLLTTIAVLLGSVMANAYAFEEDGIYYNILSSTDLTAEVTYGDNKDIDNVIIPSTVTYGGSIYNVTSIGEYAFSDCSSLTSVTIPNSVTSIGNSAFQYCSSLTSVTIPNSVTSIGNDVFFRCSSLTSVTIPNSVTSIGNNVFFGCSSLTSVTIPNSVTSIGESAFSFCSSLTSVTIPNSVTSIGEWAFHGCSSLTSVTIPNSVTSIGESAFRSCYALTSITIPNSVTSIGESAFCFCSSLTSVTIPNSVTSIEEDAFYDCSSLTSVTIPNSVTSIGEWAFFGCSSLTSVTIPNSVTNIGSSAFKNCSSLTSITCEAATPPTLGSDAFDGVSMSIPVYVPCGCVEAYKAASSWKNFTNIQVPLLEYSIEVDVNDSIMGTAKVDINSACGTQISATPNIGYHFVQWSDGNTDAIRTLELTQDTTLTAEFAQSFSGQCGDSLYWELVDTTLHITGKGEMYDYESNTAPWKLLVSSIKSLSVSEGTTSIGNRAFYRCSSLTSVTIPNSVTSIGDYTFRSCSSLTSITIPNSVTSIGYAAFYGCSALDSIVWNAKNCADVSAIKDAPFDGITSQIKSFTFGDAVEYVPAYLCYGMEKLTNVTLSNKVKKIGTSAFAGCARLGKINLGTDLEEIAANAFAGCTRLYDIYVYATYPPFADESSFANYNVYVYIPCEYQRDYILDVVWGKFKFIECIDSEEVTTDDVVVTPGANDVTITWPTEGNADTYTIVIKKGNEVFCTLTFNADGQLLNIAFAPGRDGNRPAQYAEQAGNGYRFTVTSLESGTKYAYNIEVKDAANKTIKSHSGEFTTQSTTAVDNVTTNNANIQKIMRDGQLIIIRDGVEYNAVGQEL